MHAGMASLFNVSLGPPRTYRSGNLGGAARPLEDHLPGRLALEGRLPKRGKRTFIYVYSDPFI